MEQIPEEAVVRNLLAILVFGALLPLLGCDSTGPLDKVALPGPGPTGLDEQQFSDVPVPRGFRLLTDRSFSHQSGNLRLARFVYQGQSKSPAAARQHYETQMVRPLYGWTIDPVDSDGEIVRFRKGQDRTRIRCEKHGDFTRITVDVNYSEDVTRTQP